MVGKYYLHFLLLTMGHACLCADDIVITNGLASFDERSLTTLAQTQEGEVAINRLYISLQGIVSHPLLIQEVVQLDTYGYQFNPIFKKPIKLIKPLANHDSLALVLADMPGSIFIVQGQNKDQRVCSISSISDSLEEIDANIEALEYIYTSTGGALQHNLVAAVSPQGGSFGDAGSGFALLHYGSQLIPKSDLQSTTPEQELQPKLWYLVTSTQQGEKTICPFDENIAGISINGGLKAIEPGSVVLYSVPWLARIFVGLTATSKEDATDEQGICALASLRIKDKKIQVDPLLPNNFFGAAGIISARGPAKRVAVHKLGFMLTTMQSPYLLCVAGQGNDKETTKNVYALPLAIRGSDLDTPDKMYTTITSDPMHATIASLSQEHHVYSKYRAHKTKQIASFTQPLQADEPSYTCLDEAVWVGGASLSGPITDIKVVEDVLIASVAEGEHAGIFYSQAILNEKGFIVSWTPWRRYGGINESVTAFQYYAAESILTYLTPKPESHQLKIASWRSLKNNDVITSTDHLPCLLARLNDYFKDDEGGIYSLVEHETQGTDEHPSMKGMFVVGHQKIALLWSSQACDSSSENDITHYWDIAPVLDKSAVQSVGPLSNCAIIKTLHQEYLLVGGASGLFVLSDGHGKGWLKTDSFEQRIDSLKTRAMSLKKIGSDFVKKIVVDGPWAYVLTTTALVRMQCGEDGSVKEYVPLATLDKQGVLFDISSNGPLMQLATSKGLLCNTFDIRCTSHPDWYVVEVPAQGCCTRLLSMWSGLASDKHYGLGYALFNNYSTHEAAVCRLHLQANECALREKKAVVSLQEDNKKITPFLSFITQQEMFFTDGLHYLAVQPPLNKRAALVYLIPAKERMLLGSKGNLCKQLLANEKGHNVNQIVYSSMLQTILIVGESGIGFLR